LRETRDRYGYQVRGHNALWMLEPDGKLRKIYEPCCGSTTLGGLRWSPGGRVLAASLSTGCAGCDGRAGHPLQLIDPSSGAITELGVTLGDGWAVRWSSAGALAYVQGTMERRAEAVLTVRLPDGTVRLMERGGYAPAWDPTDDRLAWARADGSVRIASLEAGGKDEFVNCPGMRIDGVRFAADGKALLLLCRKDDPSFDRFELWYASGGSVTQLVTDIGGTLRSIARDLYDTVAWSRGGP
jgi:hypothetical protein